MPAITHVFERDAYWWLSDKAKKTKEEVTRDENKIVEATLKIRLLYDAGSPLYTKEMIRNVDRQLEFLASLPQDSRRGQRITVQDLEENQVEFEVESGLNLPGGSTIPGGKLDIEMVVGEPFISYMPIQRLTSTVENPNPRLAYCSLQIHHYMDRQNKFSKEPVDQCNSQPYKEVDVFFRTIQVAWEASETCQQLRATLLAVPTTYCKVVGIGLGAMAHGDRASTRAAYQHALLLTLQEILWEKEKRGNVQCSRQLRRGIIYAQDPGYTPVDHLVLQEHTIRVVGNPKGFLEVDNGTAVVSCAPSVPVKQIIADLAQPSIMIVDRVSKQEDNILRLDPDSPRVRQQVSEFYDVFPFYGQQEYFGEAVLYVKRQEIEEKR